MKLYTVNKNDFFNAFSVKDKSYFNVMDKCIKQLVDSCNLKGQTLLSVGGGEGIEEFFFDKYGVDVTIVDMDDSNYIVKTITKLREDKNDGLTYYIGDATKETIPEKKYNVIYFSGFTPLEMDHRRVLESCMMKAPFRFLFETRVVNHILWNRVSPFHCSVTNYIDKYLDQQKGYVIIQSYYSGIDPLVHKGFIPAVEDYMQRRNICLKAVYHWVEEPGVTLYIASNSSLQHGIIDDFHGRGRRLADHSIEQIY